MKERIAEIRAAIVAESVSWSELYELQCIGEESPELLADDVLLQEWAGLPEDLKPWPSTEKAARDLGFNVDSPSWDEARKDWEGGAA